ncbi:CoB--CoM heterodisulfide reductase iron-sulfur subunit B family protein [Anaerospora sp.]|uniref:CoB--CoM heterodisulfide reductase iron-sulfur subunit B family protein n=1 Tax=Anaerospora sp. TaxID=1960278 RepID=UPI0028A03327|nr:CoB--CoM heterodisulfide reductase iron-sulfur subunit B family protein [Anaerospora sp.]
MKMTYYPGCSLHSTASEYNASTGYVFKELGIELTEIEDWNCCGASSAHATNHYLSLALPLRNLVLAEQAENDVLAPCSACYNLLKYTDHQIRQQAPEAEGINGDLEKIVGNKYGATIQVRHPLEILSSKEMLRAVKAKTIRPLAGLNVVTYYGCLLTRPKDVVAFDNPEHPQSMDKLVSALGADVKKWSYKTDCCGVALNLPRTEVVETLVAKLITEAQRAGAQAIVVACPMCHVNLDIRQTKVAKTMPIFYFTELMGIAFGAPAPQAWLRKHVIDPMSVLPVAERGGK